MMLSINVLIDNRKTCLSHLMSIDYTTSLNEPLIYSLAKNKSMFVNLDLLINSLISLTMKLDLASKSLPIILCGHQFTYLINTTYLVFDFYIKITQKTFKVKFYALIVLGLNISTCIVILSPTWNNWRCDLCSFVILSKVCLAM